MRLSLPLLALIAATLALPAKADTLVLAADEWCPYNCTPGSAREGYLIDIAKAVFEKAGHRVTYKTTNWSRALADARSGKITGVVGAHREEAPTLIFPSTPQGNAQDFFYVLKENPWRYKNQDSLNHIKLAVINNYTYSPAIDHLIANSSTAHSKRIHIASGNNALTNNIHMLLKHRVDALIENKNVFNATISKMNLQDRFVSAGQASTIKPVYIAFSPKHPHAAAYAQLLVDGIDALRKSGELEKILNTYAISDWQNNME